MFSQLTYKDRWMSNKGIPRLCEQASALFMTGLFLVGKPTGSPFGNMQANYTQLHLSSYSYATLWMWMCVCPDVNFATAYTIMEINFAKASSADMLSFMLCNN